MCVPHTMEPKSQKHTAVGGMIFFKLLTVTVPVNVAFPENLTEPIAISTELD